MNLSTQGRVELVRIEPEENMRRFYAIEAGVDLFGTYGVLRTWGRIGQPGRIRFEPHKNEGCALEEVDFTCRQKIRRGYVER